MLAIWRNRLAYSLLKHLGSFPAEYHSQLAVAAVPRSVIDANLRPNLQIWRFKSKKGTSKKAEVTESTTGDEEVEFEDQVADKNSKVMDLTMKSVRVDALLKSGLGMARNKIETLFYDSKIRVNGEKLLKKSATFNEGDEVDVVKGPSPTNPEFLVVARVEVLGISEKGENVNVRVRRCKSLTIENYQTVSK